MDVWDGNMPDFEEEDPQKEEHSVVSAEQEKMYIGYSMKLRAAIDRFDSIIRELRLKEDGLDGERRRRKNELEGTRWFILIGIVIWVLAVLFIIFLRFGSLHGYQTGVMQKLVPVFIFTLIPLLFYTLWIILKYIRAKKAYQEYMKEKSYDNGKNRFNTYYAKMDYYAKCISILEKRRKGFQTILKKLEKGEALTEKEVGLLEGMSDDMYRIPEMGFTFHEM